MNSSASPRHRRAEICTYIRLLLQHISQTHDLGSRICDVYSLSREISRRVDIKRLKQLQGSHSSSSVSSSSSSASLSHLSIFTVPGLLSITLASLSSSSSSVSAAHLSIAYTQKRISPMQQAENLKSVTRGETMHV